VLQATCGLAEERAWAGANSPAVAGAPAGRTGWGQRPAAARVAQGPVT